MTPTRTCKCGGWIFFLAVAVVAALALTSRSFWIDECYSARFAQQPTLTACWDLLRQIKGSDPQMPFYVLWIWGCEKIVGSSELALRAVNFFWFIPALIVLMRAFAGNRRGQVAIFLAALASPFAWYYLNEARAYTMQFSTSLILFATVGHWVRHPETSVVAERGRFFIFAGALFCLCGSSLLSMILAGAPLLLALALLPPERLRAFAKQFRAGIVVTLAALLVLGIYYLWTLHSGDRATGIATTGWKNAVFIGYELAGFAGLGPGRLEIRSGGAEVFRPYALPLAAYGAVVVALAFFALQDLRQKFGAKKLLLFLLAVGLPAAAVVLASAFSHFRILGRHLAALWPAVILLLGFGLASGWRRGMAGKILGIIFVIFYLASALSLRFALRHEKDDYRAAAAFAKTALNAGQAVWWNADANAAIYYQVPLTRSGSPEPGKVTWVIHPTAEQLAAMKAPAAIVTSRPDVYDEEGSLARFAVAGGYRADTSLVAFKLWMLKP